MMPNDGNIPRMRNSAYAKKYYVARKVLKCVAHY